jgi:hypothetical protein
MSYCWLTLSPLLRWCLYHKGVRRAMSPEVARGGRVMSLRPHGIPPVPEETARVARAAFPHGSPYLTFRDALGTIFQDEDFAALFPG